MLPFKTVSVWPGLFAVSLFITIISLLCFKYFSNQQKLERARDRLFARTLELHIFRDDILSIFGAFGRVLVCILHYLRETIKPILALIIPVTLLLIHLSGWLEYRPLQRGEQTLVIVKLEPSVNAEEIKVSIIGAPEIMIETDAFRSVVDNTISWRISSQLESGKTELNIKLGEHKTTKSITCSSLVTGVSQHRTKKEIKLQLLYPGEAVLKENCPAIDISVTYPLRIIKIGAFTINWIVAIFILSIIFGLILMKPFKVKF